VPERVQLEQRATDLLRRLIGFNTVNPPGNEGPAQEWLGGLLEAAGFECELLADVPGRPNLVARLPAPADGPRLCLLGHVDTVVADPADWSVDPWGAELRDGQVWGRGAIDMKSQVAAEAAAALVLAEAGWRPEAGELLLVFTCDEETGAVHGAQWLCAQHPDRVRADMVVNEGAGAVARLGDRRVYGVCVGEKGVFRFTVTARGRAGHASVPRIGDNALVKLAPLLEALGEARPHLVPSAETARFLEALGLDGDAPEESLRELERRDARLAVLVEPMLGVTLAPTMASASAQINVIPGTAELGVDCRVPPESGEEAVRAALDGLLSDGLELEVRPGAVSGNRSPADGPLMDAIASFVEREDPGSVAAPMLMQGFSDSHWWRAAFPECVAYGFFPQRAMDVLESLPLMHAADERIPVEDLGMAAAFYAELIEAMLK
jgi:acetylornithine deacetylase/succinyl-diaminopimelate desuccinylase-like protein